MFIYKVKFYNNFIEVKAWNAAEAKEKAFTRYVEKHNENVLTIYVVLSIWKKKR